MNWQARIGGLDVDVDVQRPGVVFEELPHPDGGFTVGPQHNIPMVIFCGNNKQKVLDHLKGLDGKPLIVDCGEDWFELHDTLITDLTGPFLVLSYGRFCRGSLQDMPATKLSAT